MNEHSALELWRRKLESFQKEEALAVDPEQKFSLANRIEEAKAKIRELESTNTSVEPRDNRVAASRLPRGAKRLFGRETEIAQLESAWRDPAVHVLTVVAWGGVGKSSLLVEWVSALSARDFDGADYFDWSFYSQGTKDHSTASGDIFIQKALVFFGDEATAASTLGPWDKGARLAQLVARRKALLVLDGLEPLQHGQGSPLEGELKDPGLTALLKGLALRNPGLCVVTTREKVADLEGLRTAQQMSLERLSAAAGLDLLRSLKVHGSLDDLEKLVADVRGHALTLHLLGSYLRDAHEGDIRRRDLVRIDEADAESRNGHAFRVMEAYERFFEAEGEKGRRQLAVLRLLGLFDRVASADCLAALRKAPAIEGLTDPILALGDASWRASLSYLADRGLLVLEEDGSLDAHPLIREYFADRLRRENPEAWRAAHGRIFDFLKEVTPELPDTLAGLQPLYQAVFHGCQAGRHKEAYERVYQDRIVRRHEFFSPNKLGAYGANLGAVACFFDKQWNQLASSLSEAVQAWILNEAAFSLRALGRLREAVEPMRVVLESDIANNRWLEAAVSASNLSELELTLGDLNAAVADAEESVAFADRSGDAFQRIGKRSRRADARHQAGEEEAALALFREAERLQAERQPHYPLLYSLPGFWYCDLLLAQAERAAGSGRNARAPDRPEECDETERRVTQTLNWAVQNRLSLLTLALDHLSLGRARLYRAILAGGAALSTNAEVEIEKAVAGLRAAGQFDYIPRGLLTRAWLRHIDGAADGARADLDEAQEIAERGSMKLHLADVALYRARLFHDREALATAKKLVTECGYGRRQAEIADLEAMSADWL